MSRTMSQSPRRLAVPAALAIALVVAACSSDSANPASPLTPAEHPQFVSGPASGPLVSPVLAQGLRRTKPLSSPVSVTKVISRDGDYIDVPGTDLRLEIPRGAFSAPRMTFTVTALAGSVVAYDFQPHGAVFNVPLRFVQKLGNTNLKDVQPKAGFNSQWNGAYFAGPTALDAVTGLAAIAEFIPMDLGVMWSKGEISFQIRHFSGYMVCTGREGEEGGE